MTTTMPDIDYLDLVWTWYETSDPAQAIVWSPGGGWEIEAPGVGTIEDDRPQFTSTGKLIVVRDGWILGADRFATDSDSGFKIYDSREGAYCDTGIAAELACWLDSHADDIVRRHQPTSRS